MKTKAEEAAEEYAKSNKAKNCNSRFYSNSD